MQGRGSQLCLRCAKAQAFNDKRGLKIDCDALTFPIAKAHRFWAFAPAQFCGQGGWDMLAPLCRLGKGAHGGGWQGGVRRFIV